MIGLETERLVFRQWQHEDYPVFARFYAKEENARYVGGVKTPEEAWRLMATYIGHYELNGYSYPAIVEKLPAILLEQLACGTPTPGRT